MVNNISEMDDDEIRELVRTLLFMHDKYTVASSRTAQMTVDGIPKLELDHMATREDQYKGLQFMDHLPYTKGLLFPSSDGQMYHSRNCKFAFDIAFVSDSGKILKIEEVIPENQLATAPPNTRWAIETNGGWFKNNGLGTGNKIHIRWE